MHLNPITYTKQNKNIMQNKAMVRGGDKLYNCGDFELLHSGSIIFIIVFY